MRASRSRTEPSLAEIARAWARIGAIGFGGPPAHIALLRELCVARHAWLSDERFERALAAANMLPGPASTQLAIYCAWYLRGRRGAVLGGLCFIFPGLLAMLGLAALFLSSPPTWVRGAGMGAGAAVAAVAVRAGAALAAPSFRRAAATDRPRMLAYALAGATGAAVAGPWLVLVLFACGAAELARRHARRRAGARSGGMFGVGAIAHLGALARGGDRGWPALLVVGDTHTGRLVWMALKVGALAFGGGFVIVPLMAPDAVGTGGWMTHGQFLGAVALGQITPGPVTHTIAAVGYAASGVPGALLATLLAFAPSFGFVLLGASRFERLLADSRARAFLGGAAPAALGAIIGSAIPLADELSEAWQYGVCAASALALLIFCRGTVSTLLCAAFAGTLAALLGAPIPH
jgi:chromate transporter